MLSFLYESGYKSIREQRYSPSRNWGDPDIVCFTKTLGLVLKIEYND